MNPLETGLQRILRCNYVRCRQTSGMWIIEIVIPNISQQQKNDLWTALPSHVVSILGQAAIIWKAYIYANNNDRYTAQGTLHTLPSSWENGMHTVTLSATDCYLDITELDGELLQMGRPTGHIVFAKETLNSAGQAILPYQNGANYVWLEAMGGEYTIVPNGITLLNAQNPHEMTITLQ